MRDTRESRALVAAVLRQAKDICEKGGGGVHFVPPAGTENMNDLIIKPRHAHMACKDRLQELDVEGEEVLEFETGVYLFEVTALSPV